MAVRSNIRYIAHWVLRELAFGTYVPLSVAAAATRMRVFDVNIFDPAGGQVLVEDIDELLTYTNIEDDTLSGIPSSGTGSITATINPVTSASRDLIYRPEFLTYYELERALDRYRVQAIERAYPDAEFKVYSCGRGWWDTDAETRDDDDDSFTELAPNTENFEEGVVEFTTARTEEVLWIAGYAFNPFSTIADLILNLAHDGRWAKFQSHGSSSLVKKDANEIAEYYRKKAAMLNYL